MKLIFDIKASDFFEFGNCRFDFFIVFAASVPDIDSITFVTDGNYNSTLNVIRCCFIEFCTRASLCSNCSPIIANSTFDHRK